MEGVISKGTKIIEINGTFEPFEFALKVLTIFLGVAIAFSLKTLAKRTVVMFGLKLNPHIQPESDVYVDGKIGRIEKIGLFSTTFKVEVGGDICKRVVSNDHMDWVHLEVIKKRKETASLDDEEDDNNKNNKHDKLDEPQQESGESDKSDNTKDKAE